MRSKQSLTGHISYSPRLQFELLTVGVWVSEIALAYTFVLRRAQFEGTSGYFLPIVHVVPWLFVLRLWKDTGSLAIPEENLRIEVRRTILMIGWIAYLTIWFLEAVFLQSYRLP